MVEWNRIGRCVLMIRKILDVGTIVIPFVICAIGIIGWAECDSKIQNNQMIAGLKMAANLTESSKS